MFALVLGVGVCALDQTSKWLVLNTFSWGQSYVVIPRFFELTLVQNTGAAWGMFKAWGGALTVLAVVALVFLGAFNRQFVVGGARGRLAWGFLVGGIAGNLWDRVAHGYVVDFFRFFILGYEWPVFNVADSVICIGVGLYFLASFGGRIAGMQKQNI